MFKFAGTVYGGPTTTPIIRRVVAGATRTYTLGEMVTLNASGQVVLAATGNTGIMGVVNATIEATSGQTLIPVIANFDAVYAVTDANARQPNARANINATANGVATGTADLQHVWASSATEPSYVRIQPAKNVLRGA